MKKYQTLVVVWFVSPALAEKRALLVGINN